MVLNDGTSKGPLSEVSHRTIRTAISMKKGIKELDYRSKPWMHKVFITTALTELAVMFFCTLYVLVLSPYDRYSTFMWLIGFSGSLFLLYFACDAIVHENIVLLWVFNGGCLMLTARMWYIFISEIRFEGGLNAHYIELVALVVATSCQLIFVLLSFPISEDFGRHVFFKVGARPHIVKLYKKLQIWIALLKLDVQSTMFMVVVASFYFNSSNVGLAVSIVFLLFTTTVSIMAVVWAEAELIQKLFIFGLVSLIQPSLSIAAIVNLNVGSKTQLKDDIRRHHEQSTELNTSSVEIYYEAAMVVINSTVIICIITRLAMLVALYSVIKGFGKGLTQALMKQNDAAIVRQSPLSTSHSNEVFSNVDGNAAPEESSPVDVEQTEEWAFVDGCSRFDSVHFPDNKPPEEENELPLASRDSHRPLSESNVEFTRLRSSNATLGLLFFFNIFFLFRKLI